MSLRYCGCTGWVAAAIVIAAGGCVTHPRPVAESIVAGSSQPSGLGGAAGRAAPAATGSGVAPAATGTGVAPGETAGSVPSPAKDERRTVLDKQLDDTLEAFDVRLRQEQQKIADERDARQATVAAPTVSPSENGSDPVSAADTAPSEASGPQGGKLSKARTTRAGDLTSDRSDGVTGNAAGNGAPANVVPDGNDDDIVARRLRKAAEQETDPELKDKLWQEYVEYKNNARVR
jgi:hypothetical protein